MTVAREQGGFTLLEIAVVLLIVGLVTVFGAKLVGSITEGTRTRLTRQNIDTVKLALQAFIARTNRLPCPAVEALPPGNANYGIEAATPGTCAGTQAIGTVAFRGVVPWKSLGMTTENAVDAWGNQITYVVTNSATNLNSSTVAGMRGSIYIHSNTPVVAGLPGTGNQVNACSTTANDNICNAAAVALLVSHGKAGAGAYTLNGTRVPLPTSAQEVENTNTDRSYVLAEPSDSFDDIVSPYSPNDMLGALFVQGVVRPPQALLQERARQVVSLIAADQVQNRTGAAGTWSYPLPAQTASIAYAFDATKFDAACDVTPVTVGALTGDPLQIRDPWGNQFRYARASNTVTGAESCPTPAAIVSLGPDGALGTGDDYIYYASLAEWKDIFSKSGW